MFLNPKNLLGSTGPWLGQLHDVGFTAWGLEVRGLGVQGFRVWGVRDLGVSGFRVEGLGV